MPDDDRLLELPDPEFGSGVVGVCDVCGQRQAVIVLTKERFKLCVLDFLNKAWIGSDRKPGVPAPLYRSERVFFPTASTASGKAPAIVLAPTKPVRHPVLLVVPDVYGITTTLLDGAIRFAREGFEVLLPDLARTEGIGASYHAALRGGSWLRGGVPVTSSKIRTLVRLYQDGLGYLLAREMVDPKKAAAFGASYGGSLAIALAGEETRLRALALAYPRPVRPREAGKLVTAPVFCVRGSRDRVAALAVEQLRESLAGTSVPITAVEVDGARHGFLSRDLPAYDLRAAEEGWAKILAFLRDTLLPPPPRPPPPPVRTTIPNPSAAAATASGTAPGPSTPAPAGRLPGPSAVPPGGPSAPA
jgi:carboxymethylenebutenolidase